MHPDKKTEGLTLGEKFDYQLTLFFSDLIDLEEKGFSWQVGKSRLCSTGEYECRIFDTPVRPKDKRICIISHAKTIREAISLALNELKSRGKYEKKSVRKSKQG